MDRLLALKGFLSNASLSIEAKKLAILIKISSMPGVDFPSDEVEVEGVDNALEYIRENPGKFIYLDNPKGSEKRFGQEEYKVMPFDYGEFTEIINPSDDMGWDVIIVPSAHSLAANNFDDSEDPYGLIPSGHRLTPVGYVPVNSDQKEWTRRTKTKEMPTGKLAPKGNDKIILAPDGNFNEDDISSIESFFGPMWNFDSIIWF